MLGNVQLGWVGGEKSIMGNGVCVCVWKGWDLEGGWGMLSIGGV